MWSSLDERIERYTDGGKPSLNPEYTLSEMRQLVGALLLFYGVPILLMATSPNLVQYFGEFSSFFIHGFLYREAIMPSMVGVFFDGLILYIAWFLAAPTRSLTKDRLLVMYHHVIYTLAARALPTFTAADLVTWRLYLLKLFFVPLMISFWFSVTSELLTQSEILGSMLGSGDSPVFILVLFGVSLLFFVDVSFFVFGYLTESTRLNNIVVSVDPTLSGWLICCICYPPFNILTAGILGGLHEVGAVFGPAWLWVVLSMVGLILLTVYALASVNLYGKASNLTYRGLVTTGTYGIVRHPAYTTKVGSWVLITSPFIVTNPWLIATVIGWTTIYILRALTEERHIKMVARAEYEAYEQQVPWRFVPYVV